VPYNPGSNHFAGSNNIKGRYPGSNSKFPWILSQYTFGFDYSDSVGLLIEQAGRVLYLYNYIMGFGCYIKEINILSRAEPKVVIVL
jgi:hypothetical protein